MTRPFGCSCPTRASKLRLARLQHRIWRAILRRNTPELRVLARRCELTSERLVADRAACRAHNTTRAVRRPV